MPKLTSKVRWEGRNTVGKVNSVLFSNLFHTYLKRTKNKTCLEIGCVPGSYLAYISKTFGYKAEGIDYLKNTKKIVSKTLRNNNITKFSIYQADFLEWIPQKKYDLVCSFGFIEHFKGAASTIVIQKHIDILKPGGMLILEVPNFTYLQYLIHWFLDRDRLQEHNLKTMNLLYYKMISKLYDLKILHLGYYGGFFRFWGLCKNANIIQRKIFHVLKSLEQRSNKIPWLKRINNRFLSPFIVFIAQKKRP